MKVLPVSFNFTSRNASPNLESQFFYTAREFKPAGKRVENFNMFAGVLAILAVGVTLLNIGIVKKAPKRVFVV